MSAVTTRDRPEDEPVYTQAFADALPPCYSLQRCVGTCMEPVIPDGSKVWFDAEEKIQPGDVAAIWWKPGKHAPGSFQIQIKRIVMPIHRNGLGHIVPGLFFYGTLNPYRSFTGYSAHVMAMHKCMGFRDADGTCWHDDFAERIEAHRDRGDVNGSVRVMEVRL